MCATCIKTTPSAGRQSRHCQKELHFDSPVRWLRPPGKAFHWHRSAASLDLLTLYEEFIETIYLIEFEIDAVLTGRLLDSHRARKCQRRLRGAELRPPQEVKDFPQGADQGATAQAGHTVLHGP